MREHSKNLLGEVVKRERKMLAMDISDLSSVTGISSAYIERIEQKRILKPYPEFINILSDALGVKLDIYLQNDLLGEESEMQIEKESHTDSDKKTASAPPEVYKNLISKKERVEDTHRRHTFIIRNDLLNRLVKHSQSERGFMKEFINIAIEYGLDELEKYTQEENE